MTLRLTHEILELETAHPFGIARGTQSAYRVVWVRLTDGDGAEGWGEADPSSYYGETADTVVAALGRLAPLLAEADPFDLETTELALWTSLKGNAAARCAISAALHDLVGKTLGVPLWKMWGLDPAKAPLTVENFLQYVKSRHYDGTIFHRVMPGFMIQGGGFTPEFKEKPTRKPVRNEAANGLPNAVGTIAMARTPAPHSATAQFFINVADNRMLNFRFPTAEGYGYAVFGKVVKGMDVVNRIVKVQTGPVPAPHENVPVKPVIIESIRLVEGAAKPASKP